MAEPFLSEIRIASFNFAPKGWALCNGQLLPINQNQALFALLGTTYGGNGQTNFALPNLRGRVPISFGAGFNLGQAGGEEAHTLTIQELPTHTHQAFAQNKVADAVAPVVPAANNYLAMAQAAVAGGGAVDVLRYSTATPTGTANPAMIGSVGGSQPHQNMMPSLALNFIIALQGIFPSQN